MEPENWVSAYADYLYSFALKRLNDPELCKDLIQDSFIAAIRSRESFKGQSSERTWLTSILRNKIIDLYRREKLKNHTAVDVYDKTFDHMFEDTGHWKPEFSPRVWQAEASLESKEFSAMFLSCMSKLPSLWSVVFTMKHIDDERSDRVCKELNLSSSNYWTIMHRAKALLRACIEKNWRKS